MVARYFLLGVVLVGGFLAWAEDKAPEPKRAPASQDDPNHAVEVRGQSRTLSMMLVLKNGKEGIDFIKPRKDYANEIENTSY